MAAYRPVPPLIVYTDNTGAALAGGALKFYEVGTTTAKDVFSDEALSVNLGNEVTLDSAGRAPSDIWVSGDVRVRLYDADSVLVDEADPVIDIGSAGTSIPSQTGHTGKFLTTDGTTPSWATIREVADPTGNSGKLLSTDGTSLLWKSLTELGLPEVNTVTGGGNFLIGTYRVQFGSDTFPAPSVSPPHGAVKAVTFPVAFASAPVCFGAWGNKNSIATHDYKPVVSCEANTTTLTAQYNINENSTDATADVSVTVPFSWLAIGLA